MEDDSDRVQVPTVCLFVQLVCAFTAVFLGTCT